MCEPVMIMMAVSAVVSAVSANNAAKSSDAAAADQLTQEYAVGADRRLQEDRMAADEQSARAKEATAAMGTLNTMLADTGLDGATSDRLINEQETEAFESQTTLDRNRAGQATQANVDNYSRRARAQSTMNQTQRPSYLGTALQIGGIAARGYGDYQRANPAPRPAPAVGAPPP